MSTFSVTNTNDSGIGSLRQAVLNANAQTGRDIISFKGVFDDKIADTITLGGSSLSITDDLEIRGKGTNSLYISGDNASHVFEISSGVTVEIEGLIIANGYNSEFTGGIYNQGILSISNSLIRDNSGYFGGGIYNTGNLTVKDTTITNNLGYLGAAIYNEGTLTVSNSSINNNYVLSQGTGSGIYNSSGIVTVDNSTISDNGGGTDGGGIYNSSGILTVNHSTIQDNKALYDGGGVYNSGVFTVANSTINNNQITITNNGGGGIYNSGEAIVNNSTISGNEAEIGGGIYNESTITVKNSTITLNTAYNYYGGGSAGGIHNSNSGNATIENSIVAGNFDNYDKDLTNTTNPDVFGNFNSNGYNLIGDLRGSKGFSTNEKLNVPIEKLLDTTLQDNGGLVKTHALVSGSPAINAGNNADIPFDVTDIDKDGNTTEQVPFDQRGSGYQRISGTRVDIGAYEAVVANVINGTAARETIYGTAGNDIITGHQGRDIISGGKGADTFVYESICDMGDTITDFQVGIDKIELRQVFQSLNLNKLNFASALSLGYLRFQAQGNNTQVWIDPDGSSGKGRAVKFLNLNNVTPSSVKNPNNFGFS
ncbi:choice-of-anchor Q domain-containing protein [Nostoc sp. UHCC 0302]|uniref:choice-of-anchor Q domain-containing protein n=1 Tax=Nostoc sp. UHCC 0302 TaxID=3134896 RepID=UPI00311C8A5A